MNVQHHQFSFELPDPMDPVDASRLPASVFAYLENGDPALQEARFIKPHQSRPRLSLIVDGGPCADEASFRSLCDAAATATALTNEKGLGHASEVSAEAAPHVDQVFTWLFTNARGTTQVVAKIRQDKRWLSLSCASDIYPDDVLEGRLLQIVETVRSITRGTS